MIVPAKGNLLTAQAEALVNTVNCVGVMGRGIALQFKKAHPDNFKAYAHACKNRQLVPGRMFVFDRSSFDLPRYIINFPTKDHWKGKSRIEFITSGLKALHDEVQRLGIKSIAVPPLGCGNGGLSWSEVRPLICEAFADLPDVEVQLFEPAGAPQAAAMPVKTAKPRLTIIKAALLKLIEMYKAVDTYWITRLEIQKLAYFWHECGDGRDRLVFQKWYYGPYSTGLEHMMQDMDGHWLSGCGDDNKPYQEIELIPHAMNEVHEVFDQYADDALKTQLNRVIDLVDGFTTPYGIELLATTHYVATHNTRLAISPESAIQLIHSWNGHKRQFTDHQITCAWKRLEDKGWIMR